ncbi:Sporulation and spore germination [Abditibacterium utsteinense]|uniref:Sporulation and spore germination n=1 Tax=Abditibacterium utsteinense TaxID=1960156 RepID=A0A2S8SSL1_9BACT|nr:GerMN domain-containing protein [Abditibacterium utsteinense]PQV63766.1 Sporulation and spore germination [Abditibacterium utsteinense]
MRALTSITCLLGLLTVSMLKPAFCAPAVSVPNPQKMKGQSARSGVGYGSYGSYFESNQSGLKGRASYLAFANRRAFDKVFGAGAVMGNNKFLLESAFQSGLVVAVIKRGKVLWNYRVQRVMASNNAITVHYSAKSIGAEDSPQGATFASPLIVAVDKKNCTSVSFVENGKSVARIAVNAPKVQAPQKIKAPLIPRKTQNPQKIQVAPLVRSAPNSPAGERFFEGTYRVGAIICKVNPIKMAFEVQWPGRQKPQLFFFDSLASGKANSKRIYRAEESGGSSRFVFDNARFESGQFVRADGKTLPIRKISKPRIATRLISVYLVAVGDAGKIGRKFGCDDSLVPVRRAVSTLESPLKSALQELISLPPIYPNNPKLQNFWKGRDLQIQTVSVRGGTARIQIAGEVSVAGVCDEPRIITQIEATARQFPSVKRVKVFIGGKSLRSAIQ